MIFNSFAIYFSILLFAYCFSTISSSKEIVEDTQSYLSQEMITGKATPSLTLDRLWNYQDIGNVAKAGLAETCDGINWTAYDFMRLFSGGYDIWGTDDAFQFAYREIVGDLTIITRANLPEPIDYSPIKSYAKGGIMIRKSLDPSSQYAATYLSPGYGVAPQYRPSFGASSIGGTNKYALGNSRVWLKLERVANEVKAYYSLDGISWTKNRDWTIEFGDGPLYVGLACTTLETTAVWVKCGFWWVSILLSIDLEPSPAEGFWQPGAPLFLTPSLPLPPYPGASPGDSMEISLSSGSLMISDDDGTTWTDSPNTLGLSSSCSSAMISGETLEYPSSCLREGYTYKGSVNIIVLGETVSVGSFRYKTIVGGSNLITSPSYKCGNATVVFEDDPTSSDNYRYRARAAMISPECAGTVDVFYSFGLHPETGPLSTLPTVSLDPDSSYSFGTSCQLTSPSDVNVMFTVQCNDIEFTEDNWYFDIFMEAPKIYDQLVHSVIVSPHQSYTTLAWDQFIFSHPLNQKFVWNHVHLAGQFSFSQSPASMGGAPLWWELFPRKQNFDLNPLTSSELSASSVIGQCGSFPWNSLTNELRYTPSLNKPSKDWIMFHEIRPFTLSASDEVISMLSLDPPTALLHRPTSGNWKPGDGRAMVVATKDGYSIGETPDMFRGMVSSTFEDSDSTVYLPLPTISINDDGTLQNTDLNFSGISGCSQLLETFSVDGGDSEYVNAISEIVLFIDICKTSTYEGFLTPNRSSEADLSLRSTCSRVSVTSDGLLLSPALSLTSLEPFNGREFVYIAAVKAKILLYSDSGYCSQLYGEYLSKTCSERELWTSPGYLYLREYYLPIEADDYIAQGHTWENLKETLFFRSVYSVYSDTIVYDDEPWLHPTDWVPFPPFYVLPNTQLEYTADPHFGIHLNSTRTIEMDPSKPGYLDNYYAMPHPSVSNAFRGSSYTSPWNVLASPRMVWPEEFTWSFHRGFEENSDLSEDHLQWMCGATRIGTQLEWEQNSGFVPSLFPDVSADPLLFAALSLGTEVFTGSVPGGSEGDVMITTCTLSIVFNISVSVPVDSYVIPVLTLSSPWTLTTGITAPTLHASSTQDGDCWPETPSGRMLYETDYFPAALFDLLEWNATYWRELQTCAELSDGSWPFDSSYTGNSWAEVVTHNSFRMVPYAICPDQRITYQVSPGVMSLACEGRYERIGYSARDINGNVFLYSRTDTDRDVNRVVWDPYLHIEDAYFRYYRYKEFDTYLWEAVPPREYYTDGISFCTEPSFCAVASRLHPNGIWPVELNYTMTVDSVAYENQLLLSVDDDELEKSIKACWQIDINAFNQDGVTYIADGNVLEFTINVTKRAGDFTLIPPNIVHHTIRVDQGTPQCGLQDPEGNDMCLYLWSGTSEALEVAVAENDPILRRTAVNTPNGVKFMVGPLRNEHSPIMNVTLELNGVFADGQAKRIRCSYNVEHWWDTNYIDTDKPVCGINETCYFPFSFGTESSDNCDAVQLGAFKDYGVSVEAINAVGHKWSRNNTDTDTSVIVRYDETDPECDPMSCGVCFGDVHDCVYEKTQNIIGTTNNTHATISFSGWEDSGSYMLFYTARLAGPLIDNEAGDDLIVDPSGGQINWLSKFPGYDYYDPGDGLDWTLIYNYTAEVVTRPFSVVLPFTSTPPEGRYRLYTWGYNGLFLDDNDVSRQNRESDIDLYIDLQDVGDWSFFISGEDTSEWDLLRATNGYLWTTKTNSIPISVTGLSTAGGISDISHVSFKIVQGDNEGTSTSVPSTASNHTIDLGWYSVLKDEDQLVYQMVQEDMWPSSGELSPGNYVIEACLSKYNGKVRCKHDYLHVTTGELSAPTGTVSFPTVPHINTDGVLTALFTQKQIDLEVNTDYASSMPSGVADIELWFATTGTPTAGDYIIEPFNLTNDAVDYTIDSSSALSSLNEGWYFLGSAAYSKFAKGDTNVYKVWLDVDPPIAGPVCSGPPGYDNEGEVLCNTNVDTGSHKPIYTGDTVYIHWSPFVDEVNVTYEVCVGSTSQGCEYSTWSSTVDRNVSLNLPAIPVETTVHLCVRATDLSGHISTACATTIHVAPDFSDISIRVSSTTGSAVQMPSNITYISDGTRLYAEWDEPTLPASIQGSYTMEYQVCIEEASTHGETDHTFKTFDSADGYHGEDPFQGTCSPAILSDPIQNDDATSISIQPLSLESGKWYRLQIAINIDVLPDYVGLYSHAIKVETHLPGGTYLLNVDSFSQHTVASCQNDGGLSSTAPFPENQYFYGSEEASPEISLVFCGLIPDEHFRVEKAQVSLHTWPSSQNLPTPTSVSVDGADKAMISLPSPSLQVGDGTDLGMKIQVATSDLMTRTLIPASLRHVLKVHIETRSGQTIDFYTVSFSFEECLDSPSISASLSDLSGSSLNGVTVVSVCPMLSLHTFMVSLPDTVSDVVYQGIVVDFDLTTSFTGWTGMTAGGTEGQMSFDVSCDDIPKEKVVRLQMRAINPLSSVTSSPTITVSGLLIFTSTNDKVEVESTVDGIAGVSSFSLCSRYSTKPCYVSTSSQVVAFYWSYRSTSDVGIHSIQVRLCQGADLTGAVCSSPSWTKDAGFDTEIASTISISDGIYTPYLCMGDVLGRETCVTGANLHIDTTPQLSVSLDSITGDNSFTVSYTVDTLGETVCDHIILMIGMQVGSGAILTEERVCTNSNVEVMFDESVHNRHIYASIVAFDSLGRSSSDSLDLGVTLSVPPPTPDLIVSNLHSTRIGPKTDRLYFHPASMKIDPWSPSSLSTGASTRISTMKCTITVEDMVGQEYVISEDFSTKHAKRTLDLVELLSGVDWTCSHPVSVNSSFQGVGGINFVVLKLHTFPTGFDPTAPSLSVLPLPGLKSALVNFELPCSIELAGLPKWRTITTDADLSSSSYMDDSPLSSIPKTLPYVDQVGGKLTWTWIAQFSSFADSSIKSTFGVLLDLTLADGVMVQRAEAADFTQGGDILYSELRSPPVQPLLEVAEPFTFQEETDTLFSTYYTVSMPVSTPNDVLFSTCTYQGCGCEIYMAAATTDLTDISSLDDDAVIWHEPILTDPIMSHSVFGNVKQTSGTLELLKAYQPDVPFVLALTCEDTPLGQAGGIGPFVFQPSAPTLGWSRSAPVISLSLDSFEEQDNDVLDVSFTGSVTTKSWGTMSVDVLVSLNHSLYLCDETCISVMEWDSSGFTSCNAELIKNPVVFVNSDYSFDIDFTLVVTDQDVFRASRIEIRETALLSYMHWTIQSVHPSNPPSMDMFNLLPPRHRDLKLHSSVTLMQSQQGDDDMDLLITAASDKQLEITASWLFTDENVLKNGNHKQYISLECYNRSGVLQLQTRQTPDSSQVIFHSPTMLVDANDVSCTAYLTSCALNVGTSGSSCFSSSYDHMIIFGSEAISDVSCSISSAEPSVLVSLPKRCKTADDCFDGFITIRASESDQGLADLGGKVVALEDEASEVRLQLPSSFNTPCYLSIYTKYNTRIIECTI
eukprot:gnl/Dysnectes_brevis/2273_a2665_714.p1 GENE.gnl/Dysnectes_brevis/2273_a2665_714~~gnl/Dysnectes_brevis/2273_a2665_714.p1  ORF type:complete len:3480 (-),score=166.86 gnl/Dysnectes_brevis/2273_a2665_714:44-10483(-)